jgi:hypothetical protein
MHDFSGFSYWDSSSYLWIAPEDTFEWPNDLHCESCSRFLIPSFLVDPQGLCFCDMACARIYTLDMARDTQYFLPITSCNAETSGTATLGAGSSTEPVQPRAIRTSFAPNPFLPDSAAAGIPMQGIPSISEISSGAESKREEETFPEDSSSKYPSESDPTYDEVPHSYSENMSEPESILVQVLESESDNSESDHAEEIFDMLSSDVSDEGDTL